MRWARTVNGKSIPLDPEPVPGGNVELRDGLACVVKPDGAARYVSHFATCKNANGHRATPRRVSARAKP